MKTLQEMRESRGATKKAVMQVIGVSYPTYNRYEEDPRQMSVGDLEKVCKFLHCKKDEIFLDQAFN